MKKIKKSKNSLRFFEWINSIHFHCLDEVADVAVDFKIAFKKVHTIEVLTMVHVY